MKYETLVGQLQLFAVILLKCMKKCSVKCKKLEKSGIVWYPDGWLESIMKYRTHCVIMNNTTSSD